MYEKKKAEVCSVIYKPLKRIETKGKRSDLKGYIEDGYVIKEAKDGVWILLKPAELNVTLKNYMCIKTFNMRKQICSHYDETSISESLVDRFQEDIKNEMVRFYMDYKGEYEILWKFY